MRSGQRTVRSVPVVTAYALTGVTFAFAGAVIRAKLQLRAVATLIICIALAFTVNAFTVTGTVICTFTKVTVNAGPSGRAHAREFGLIASTAGVISAAFDTRLNTTIDTAPAAIALTRGKSGGRVWEQTHTIHRALIRAVIRSAIESTVTGFAMTQTGFGIARAVCIRAVTVVWTRAGSRSG